LWSKVLSSIYVRIREVAQWNDRHIDKGLLVLFFRKERFVFSVFLKKEPKNFCLFRVGFTGSGCGL